MEKAFSHTFPITEDDFSLALGMIINAGQMTNGMDLLHAAEMTPELYDLHTTHTLYRTSLYI